MNGDKPGTEGDRLRTTADVKNNVLLWGENVSAGVTKRKQMIMELVLAQDSIWVSLMRRHSRTDG